MNLVASQFDKQDKSVEAVTARNKVLNKEIELQKEMEGEAEKAGIRNDDDVMDLVKDVRAEIEGL